MVEFEVINERFHDYVADFIPFFLICIVIELLVNVLFKKKKNYFSLDDSLSSFAAGISTIVLERIVPFAFMSVMEFFAVVYIYKNYRLFDVSESSTLSWILCFFTIDFGYYWFHRFAHECRGGWATHVTHHSSEKYNLTTALRQNSIQIFISWIFYLPLGLFTPPGIYIFHKQFNTINQFWIHTQLIDKLPWIFEFVLNTPSHHRVHHGRNPKYLDKNYGGTLIIWDRLFNTFQEEDEKVYYGLVHPLDSNDPSWSQIHVWVEMYREMKLYGNWSDKAKVLFYGPGWKKGAPSRLGDLSLNPIPTDKDEQERLSKPLSTDLKIYLLFHHMFISLFSLIIRDSFENQIGSSNVTLCFVYLYISLTGFGAMFDRKWYAAPFEIIRLYSFIVYSLVIGSSHYIIHIIRIFYFISSLYILFKQIPLSNILKYLKSSQKIINNKLD